MMSQSQPDATLLPFSPATLGYLGPPGSHSHTAALALQQAQWLTTPVQLNPCTSLLDILTQTHHGQLTLGLIPIENALEGSVHEVVDSLHTQALHVLAEFTRPIKHGLLAHAYATLQTITTVYSHPQALGQCRQTLQRLLGASVTLMPCASTAQAAHHVATQNSPTVAALGTYQVAEMLGLTCVVPQMSDEDDNQTRFLLVTGPKIGTYPFIAEPLTAQAPSKTALSVDIGDYPGSLIDVLLVFKRANINLTRIESRPSRKGLGRYHFYIDVAADLTQPAYASLLPDLQAYYCNHIHSLGPYPQLGLLVH
jgi:prephenate dehydratase